MIWFMAILYFITKQAPPQKKLDSMITEFVVLGNHTFSIVEEEKFKYLMNMGFPKRKCLTRKTLMNRISNISQELKIELKEQLMSIELKYVCATADCWSSAALACRRLKGRHTFDVLAKVLHSIFCEYGIINKISRVVTDNGSNFIKAFSVHTQTSETRNTGSRVENSNDDEDGEDDNDDEIDMIEIDEILANGLEQNPEYSLPPHHRCASHTLDLVATRDSEKALSDVIYKKQMRSSFAKMQGLWNKQSRTSVVADTIHDALNVYINVPNTTRWNSTYNAVKCLSDQLQKSEAKVQRVCDESGIPRFDKNDLAFMMDYCKIMEPLSRALDILQGDKYMAMGYLIPTISWLKRKLTELSLAGKCKSFMTKEIPIIISSVSHPKFKFKGMSPFEREEGMEFFKAEVEQLQSITGIVNDNVQPATEDDFLFDGDDVEVEQPNTEINRYLTTPFSGDLLILNTMPTIKNIFLKYNTALPSSASVERLFSVAGDICTKKRGPSAVVPRQNMDIMTELAAFKRSKGSVATIRVKQHIWEGALLNRSGQDITPFTNLNRKQMSVYFRLLTRESNLRESCIELRDIDSDG
ncbi:hypothetical protein QTP88_013522 [Uroleucon formosanum]